MHINAAPQTDPFVMPIQNQGVQAGSQNANVARLSCRTDLMCYMSGNKGHLAREFHHTGNINDPQTHTEQPAFNSPAKQAGIALLHTTNLFLL